nr:MDIS1-interacting receptor like kinase 2-like [Ipomoea batatas]
MTKPAYKLLLLLTIKHLLSLHFSSSSSPIPNTTNTNPFLPANNLQVGNEVGALLTWKSGLDGKSQKLLSSWVGSNSCKWIGVTCNRDGRITSMNLSGYGLKGHIPQEIGLLTSLISLEMSSNNLIGQIPTSIGNLKNLRTLYLFTNGLSGSIPATIGNLSNLRPNTYFDQKLDKIDQVYYIF